jgi:DNA-binding transcriptional regulator YiaG
MRESRLTDFKMTTTTEHLTATATALGSPRMAKHTKKSKREFAARLVSYRERAGRARGQDIPISQAEAAVALGVPKRTLQGWELGRYRPTDSMVAMLDACMASTALVVPRRVKGATNA